MKSILGMTVGLLVSGGAQAACSAADQAALEKFDRDWSAAGQSGDRAAMQAFYADDYLDLQPGAPAGREQTLDAALRDLAALKASGKPAPDLHHDFYQIHCTPHSALITHRNWGVEGEGAHAFTWNTRSIHQLEKRDGKWLVVGNATHPVSDEQRVGWLDLEWNQAELAADKGWFERTLSDDFIGVNSRTGAREDKALTLAGIGKGKVDVADTTDMETRVHGDSAIVTGVYHTRGIDEKGKAFDRKLRYIDTFVRNDGRWQLVSSQGTEIRD